MTMARGRVLAALVVVSLIVAACAGARVTIGSRGGWYGHYGPSPWNRCCGYRGWAGRGDVIVVPPDEIDPDIIDPDDGATTLPLPDDGGDLGGGGFGGGIDNDFGDVGGGFGDDFGGGGMDFGGDW